MPAWLLAAASLLRSTFVGTRVRTAITAAGGALALPTLPGGVGGLFGFGDEEEVKKRRRRRRALTQSDRNDIAFIAATIGKAAAGSFAVQLATRSR